MNKLQANNLWKARFGVTIPEAVERFNKRYENMKMSTAAKKFNFAYDVDALDAWKSNDFPNVLTDLVATSTFLENVNKMEGVKGTAEITFMNVDFSLQKVTGCQLSPDGAVEFTGDDISTVLLGSAIELCNEDLNGKVTQILNSLGVKGQDDHIPYDIEDILMMYMLKVAQKKLQDLIFLGDTTSLNPDLTHFDGLLKRWTADASIPTTTMTVPGGVWTQDNAYDIVLDFAYSAEGVLFDAGTKVAILLSPQHAIQVLRSYNAQNPYNQVALPELGTSINVPIPNTMFTIMGIAQFTGAYADSAFIVPLEFVTFATDEMDDMEWDVKYDDYNNKLKVEMKYRAGINYSFPQYFRRLVLVPPSLIVAVNDTFSATAPEGASGKTFASVFVNDTIGGVTATSALVAISSTPTAQLSINPSTGAVVLASGVTTGAYTINYTIADKANLANTATATVTVNVA